MHCGNRLTVVEQDKEPNHLDIDEPPQSWYFYEHAKSINGPSDETLSDDICAELVAIARQFSWEKDRRLKRIPAWLDRPSASLWRP